MSGDVGRCREMSGERLDVRPDVLRAVVLVRSLDVVEQLAVLDEERDGVLDLAGDELLQQPLVVEAARHYLERLCGTRERRR